MAELQPYRHGYYLWRYVPSIAAAVIFLLIFLALTLAFVWRIWKTKVKFAIPFAIGGLYEVVGYAARASAHNKTGKMMPYAVQNIGTLLAPALFAASIYMTLGRIISSVKGQSHTMIPVKWLTRTFVLGDVLSFAIQGGASGLMVVGGSLGTVGQDMVVAGLVIQAVMFAIFAATALVFHYRMRKVPTMDAQDPGNNWEQHLYMLYGVSALIMVRSIFRVIEFQLGQTGYPLSHEWTLYIFDSFPMVIVMGVYYWRFPSELKRRKEWEEISQPLSVIVSNK